MSDWQSIETCPEYEHVLLACGNGIVGRGRKFTRDDGVIWEFEGTSCHETIWPTRLPYAWQVLPLPPTES